MSTTIKDKQLECLIAIQKIDKEIQKLNKIKENIPIEIAREREIFEKINSELNKLNENVEQAKKDRRSKELETQSIADRLISTKEKLPHVKTNKEYAAILLEGENLKNKINSLEEEEIEVMERIEENQREYKLKLKENEEEEKKFLEIKKTKEEDLEHINKRLDEALNRKNELAGSIEDKLLNQYERIIDMRNGLAVVAIDDNICSGCHCSLRPQLSIEIRQNDSIISCPYCSRFLFSKQTTGVD